MKEFHRGDFANRTGLAQAWTVKSADRLFTKISNCHFLMLIARAQGFLLMQGTGDYMMAYT